MDIKLVHNDGAWLEQPGTTGSSAWHNLLMSSQQRGDMY